MLNRDFNTSDAPADRDGLLTRPLIPAVLEDGQTLPISALEQDLIVRAPVVDIPGQQTVPGDTFTIILDDVVLRSTEVTVQAGVKDFVDLRLSSDDLSVLSDGLHTIKYQARSGFDALKSLASHIRIDRSAAGGDLLPRMILPEYAELNGITPVYLDSLPGKAIRCIIPNYVDASQGDSLHFRLRHRSSGRQGDAGKIVNESAVGIVEFSIPAESILSLRGDGLVEFIYFVRDLAGNESLPSRPTVVRALLNDVPSMLSAPRLQSRTNGILVETDIRPALHIEIPTSVPKCRPGDSLDLYLRNRRIFTTQLEASDLQGDDTMLTVEVPYDTAWPLIVDGGTTERIVHCRYDIVRDDIRMPSDEATVTANLSTPGGRDPNPSTVPHDGLAAPSLHGASGGAANEISLTDVESDATIAVQRGSNALMAGDVLEAFLGGESAGDTVTVADGVAPISLNVPAEMLKAHHGTPRLYYKVSRDLGSKFGIVEVDSPSQDVTIHHKSELPGGGSDLIDCDSLAAHKAFDEVGLYGVSWKRLIEDGGLIVRVFGWPGIVVGEKLTLMFESFDGFDEGPYIPEQSGSVSKVVGITDLIPKVESAKDPCEKAIFIDLVIATEDVGRDGVGRILLSYAVTNAVGESRSAKRKVLTDFREGGRP